MEKMDKDINSGMRHGLTIVYTGNGKGKTTAALGMLLRASGHDMKIGVVQFIKGPDHEYGEAVAAKRLDFDYFTLGDGFTWKSNDLEKSREMALDAWKRAQTLILENLYDLILLDELTYLFYFKWLDVNEVVDWLKMNKPPTLHIVITGRYAPPELIDFADLATTMQETKHPLRTQGILAQAGIEY